MAHEVESAMYVKQAAWHGLGTVLDHVPGTAEAIVAAGLDWSVFKSPVFHEPEDSEFHEIAEFKALKRGSDGKVLSVVGSDWTPVQNKSAFEWFDPFVDAGHATLEAAGSLRGGQCVWVLARLTACSGEVGKGDQVNTYLLLNNWHRSGRAVAISYTPIRVVCMNTLRSAIGDDGKKAQVRIAHHPKVLETMDAVQGLADLTRKTWELSMTEYKAMRSKGLKADGLKKYVRSVLQPRHKKVVDDLIAAASAAAMEEPAPEKLPRAYESIERAFEAGPGADMAGKTVWGAYNAVTHWIDHERGKEENRLDSTWFGAGVQIRDRAHEEAIALLD